MEKNSATEGFAELRKRAKALLEKQSGSVSLSHFDTQELLYELETYQIELELQNEEMRAAQIELEQSHRRYVDLYDFAPVAYLSLNEKGGIVEANLGAVIMFGVPRKQLLNKLFHDFIATVDTDTFYLGRQKLMETQKKQSFHLTIKNSEGTFVHVQVIAVANKENCDSPGQCRLALIDISDCIALEAQLQRIKDRYRAIVMDQNELICRFDPQGRITFVNDSYCQCFGIDYRDVLGTHFQPDVYEEDQPLEYDHFTNLSEHTPVKTVTHRVRLPDGDIRWHQWDSRALYDETGEVTEYQAVGRDITELKSTQEKLQNEVDLRQQFIDALPCIAVLVEYDTNRIIAVNKAAAAVGACPGNTCSSIWGKSVGDCAWCLGAELRSKEEVQNNQVWENNVYWDVYWVPVNEQVFLHYLFDITEQYKTKRALEKSRVELEQRVADRTLELQKSHRQLLHAEKLAAIGKFSASISHEFNNPLQSILTIIKGLQKYVPFQKKESSLVELAIQECYRLKDLIAGLKDFHLPTAGVKTEVNLHELLDALLLMVKKEFSTRRIRVEKSYVDSLPPIMAVKDQLKQVFLNILINASDACEGEGMISIKTDRMEENIVVNISDNGNGIEQAHLESIFEPFFTTKQENKSTGLGLSVSYGIIKKHGGTIEAHSEPGQGTTFSVVLPMRMSDDE